LGMSRPYFLVYVISPLFSSLADLPHCYLTDSALLYRLVVYSCLIVFPHSAPRDPIILLFSLGTLWYFAASCCTIKDYLLLLRIGSKVSCLVPFPLHINLVLYSLIRAAVSCDAIKNSLSSLKHRLCNIKLL
jgi:hypothetical protein